MLCAYVPAMATLRMCTYCIVQYGGVLVFQQTLRQQLHDIVGLLIVKCLLCMLCTYIRMNTDCSLNVVLCSTVKHWYSNTL